MPRDYSNNKDHGLLFTARSKEKPGSPDLTGNGEITCPHCGKVGRFWLSGWKKVSEKAGNFLSVSFRAKEEAPRAVVSQHSAEPGKFPWES